jgi:hypothetical protein
MEKDIFDQINAGQPDRIKNFFHQERTSSVKPESKQPTLEEVEAMLTDLTCAELIQARATAMPQECVSPFPDSLKEGEFTELKLPKDEFSEFTDL